ncbi:DUF4269 domain-containing protein [Aquisalibacillus elongatus]|uniref:Uncharacterized protein DUF4269 n=1 Tax=Aquisalibacillus elongatus TaxID=485577 RepID=A0A3N5C1C9_9BACI|nr:DUF4269 domain-containing protein [Aquisalibacillus elongatus]RPF53172.1 uncharacterized protein DUF4269 [Aquisalibacillus elongatus]
MLTFEQLKYGTNNQQKAYDSIKKLGIFEGLSEYTPVLCGTIPIDVDIEDSDLDLILEVHDFEEFKLLVTSLYSEMPGFTIAEKQIRGESIIKCNFIYEGFEFELFAQATPVKKQYAYLHMVVEYHILKRKPYLKEQIKQWKRDGYKTEPAFCKALDLNGDSYESLIDYGIRHSIIEEVNHD